MDTIVREKYYKGLLVPFVLQEMTSQLFGVVETLFISHDPGAELCTEPEQWALERGESSTRHGNVRPFIQHVFLHAFMHVSVLKMCVCMCVVVVVWMYECW